MQNIKTKKKINNNNNLKEIKSLRTNQNIGGNEENQLTKLKKINQPIIEKRSKSKRGLSKQTSTSKINIVSYIFLLFYLFP
jgi:hypothetical protein